MDIPVSYSYFFRKRNSSLQFTSTNYPNSVKNWTILLNYRTWWLFLEYIFFLCFTTDKESAMWANQTFWLAILLSQYEYESLYINLQLVMNDDRCEQLRNLPWQEQDLLCLRLKNEWKFGTWLNTASNYRIQ